MPCLPRLGDRYDAHVVGRRQRAAMARSGAQALLAFGHRRRQALRRQQQETLVALVRPAQCDGIRVRNPSHARREAAGEFLQCRRLRHQRGHVIERLEAFALFLELRRLLRHLGLEVPIHRLQMPGHAIEAFRERAEFVGGHAVHAGTEVAALQAFRRLFQVTHGFQHEQIAGVEQHGRAEHRKCHHRHLQDVQQRGPPRHVMLDAGDKRVDVAGKGGRVLVQSHQCRWWRSGPLAAELRPVPFDHREPAPHDVVPGHEQRPLEITVPEHVEAALEFRHLPRQCGNLAGAGRQRHAVRLHPHAARFVDRRRAAVELPGHPKGQRDRQQRQQEERQADERKLRAQAPVTRMAHRASISTGCPKSLPWINPAGPATVGDGTPLTGNPPDGRAVRSATIVACPTPSLPCALDSSSRSRCSRWS